jgi:hypothetical protein
VANKPNLLTSLVRTGQFTEVLNQDIRIKIIQDVAKRTLNSDDTDHLINAKTNPERV